MRPRKDTLLLFALVLAIPVLLMQPKEPNTKNDASNRPVMEPSQFELSIESDKSVYEIGEAPQVTAKLINKSDHSVVLIPALDGSDFGRYPLVKWSIDAPQDAMPLEQFGRCGNTNPLRANEFFAVAAGESFDVAGGWGRIPLRELDRGVGEYTIQLAYATDEPDPKRWLGFGFNPSDYPQESVLLEKVPRVQLKSNVLKIRIENPYETSQELLREGTFDQVMFALRLIQLGEVEGNESEAIVDALTRFEPAKRSDRNYERLVREAIPCLARYATQEDADRVWSLVGDSVVNRTFERFYGRRYDGVLEDLVLVFLQSRTSERYKRLAFLLSGQTAFMPGGSPIRPKVDMPPEIAAVLGTVPGEDIDRLLRELLQGGTELSPEAHAAIASALRMRRLDVQ